MRSVFLFVSLGLLCGAVCGADADGNLWSTCYPNCPTTARTLSGAHDAMMRHAEDGAASLVLAGTMDEGLVYTTELMAKHYASSVTIRLGPTLNVASERARIQRAVYSALASASPVGGQPSLLVIVHGLENLTRDTVSVLDVLMKPLDSRPQLPSPAASSAPLSTVGCGFVLLYNSGGAPIDDVKESLESRWSTEGKAFNVHAFLGRIRQFVSLPALTQEASSSWRRARAHNHMCGGDPRAQLSGWFAGSLGCLVATAMAGANVAHLPSTTPGDVAVARFYFEFFAWGVLGAGVFLFLYGSRKKDRVRTVYLGSLNTLNASNPDAMENPVTVDPVEFNQIAHDPLATPRPSPPQERQPGRSRSRSRSRSRGPVVRRSSSRVRRTIR